MERRGFLGRLFVAPVVAKALEKGVTFETPAATVPAASMASVGWQAGQSPRPYPQVSVSTYWYPMSTSVYYGSGR